MKDYDYCVAWMKSIWELRKSLPEGVGLCSTTQGQAGRFTLKEVDPEALAKLAQEYQAKLVEQAGGNVMYVDINYPIHRHPKMGFTPLRFFYRKTSGRERREAYDYAF